MSGVYSDYDAIMIITAIDYNKIPEGTPEEEIPTPGIYFNHIHYSTPESSGGAGGRNYDFYTTKLQLVGEIKQLDEKYLPDMKTINGESILGEGNIEVSVNLDSLNIKNSIGASSLQQVQDTGYTGIAIKTKNPNAYALDNTLTDNEPIGATGAFASSFGGVTSAQGKRSFAEGTNTIAKGKYSHAEGDNTVALGNDSHTEGLNCVSFGSGSHSEGGSTQAIGMHAHSEGVNTIARGDASHAGGSRSVTDGIHSFAHGNNVIAGYDNQFVVGRFNKNRSNSIFEVGLGSDDANRSTCFYISQDNGAAYSNFSNGYSPIYDPNRYATQSEVSQAITTEVPVIGGSTTLNAVALRNGQSSALYDGCVALGVQTTASGNASAAFNSNTQATGNDSSAIGRQTIASGIASHSQGYAAQAQGDNSHAEGDNTIAEGKNSHAEGVRSYAKGTHSHTQGNNTQALADNSSAAGNHTIAGYANQFTIGKFNNNKSKTVFEVGNGADNSNRSNAFEVYNDGHAEIQTMGSTDKSITTKKYVDEKTVVDQEFNSKSENAQSGKAVAEAIKNIPQADWQQNDETKSDYIKNRTHYATKAFEDITWDGDKTDHIMFDLGDGIQFFKVSDKTPSIDELIGGTFTINTPDGEMDFPENLDESFIAELPGALVIAEENVLIIHDIDIFVDFVEEDLGLTFDNATNGVYFLCNTVEDTYVSKLVSGEKVVKKINEKYLPDISIVAKTGSYKDLKNKPDIYTKSEIDTKFETKLEESKRYADSIDSRVVKQGYCLELDNISTKHKAEITTSKNTIINMYDSKSTLLFRDDEGLDTRVDEHFYSECVIKLVCTYDDDSEDTHTFDYIEGYSDIDVGRIYSFTLKKPVVKLSVMYGFEIKYNRAHRTKIINTHIPENTTLSIYVSARHWENEIWFWLYRLYIIEGEPIKKLIADENGNIPSEELILPYSLLVSTTEDKITAKYLSAVDKEYLEKHLDDIVETNVKSTLTNPDEEWTNEEQVNARATLNAQENLISGENIKTINGKSVLGEGDLIIDGSGETIDMTDYVKKTDYPKQNEDNSNIAGVVKTRTDDSWGKGIEVDSNGFIQVHAANKGDISNKTQEHRPITPKHLDHAVKEGLVNTTVDWAETEKGKVRELLGLTQASTEEIVQKQNYTKPITPNTLDFAIKQGLIDNNQSWSEYEKRDARTLIGAASIESLAKKLSKDDCITAISLKPNTYLEVEPSTLYILIHDNGENKIQLKLKKDDGTIVDAVAGDTSMPAFQGGALLIPKDIYTKGMDYYEARMCLLLAITGKSFVGIPEITRKQFRYDLSNTEEPFRDYVNYYPMSIYNSSTDSRNVSVWKIKL